MGLASKGSRIFQLVAGLSVTGGTVGYVVYERNRRREQQADLSNTSPLGKVLASWTTNFKPSVPWDRRDPKSVVKPPKGGDETDDYKEDLKKATPSKSRHLILIRHGQYNLDGETDIQRTLTELGHRQADATGKRLKDLDYPYSLLIHSTMTRAIETASDIHKHVSHLPIETCDLLREGAPIPPEPPVGHWRPEPQQFFQDGARIEAAFRKYFHRAGASQEQDSYEIVVCHANVIRYFVCRALQLPPEAWLRMSLHHGSLTWVTIRPTGRVALRYLGDAGFMPKNMMTTS